MADAVQRRSDPDFSPLFSVNRRRPQFEVSIVLYLPLFGSRK